MAKNRRTFLKCQTNRCHMPMTQQKTTNSRCPDKQKNVHTIPSIDRRLKSKLQTISERRLGIYPSPTYRNNSRTFFESENIETPGKHTDVITMNRTYHSINNLHLLPSPLPCTLTFTFSPPPSRVHLLLPCTSSAPVYVFCSSVRLLLQCTSSV